MRERDIVRLELALGTMVEHGATRDAVLAAPASFSSALGALSGGAKAAALQSLALRGARELRLVPELVRSLADPDRAVRHAAAALLESTAAEVGLGPFAADATEALIASLADEDRRVRSCAVGALAAIRYPDPEAVERVLGEISRASLAPERGSVARLARALRGLLAQLPADPPAPPARG